MTNQAADELIKLYDSLLKMKPFPSALDTDWAWFNGTLHGVKLSIAAVSKSFKGDK